jgi:hypothetical protein
MPTPEYWVADVLLRACVMGNQQVLGAWFARLRVGVASMTPGDIKTRYKAVAVTMKMSSTVTLSVLLFVSG